MGADDPTPAGDDVRAAVAAGVLEPAAAARLGAFLDARRGARSALTPDDEPFELFRGFGEVFVSIGLVLLLAPLGVWLGPIFGALTGVDAALAAGAVGGAIVVSLARYFTRRRRMVLPSVVLAIAFAVFAVAFAVGAFDAVHGGSDWPFMLVPACGLAAMAAYYGYFRLPFALALMGGLALTTVLAVAEIITGDDAAYGMAFGDASTYLDLVQAPTHALGVLLYGIVVFVVAMRFDLRDPHRLTRQSACAFWLHVTAAPALVNTVCISLYNLGGPAGYIGAGVGFLAVTLLALVIDRRSFLVAGVIYAGLVVGAAFEAAGGGDIAAPLTVLSLGGFITLLGAKWVEARGRLLRALPDFPGKDRLPPY